MKIVKTPHKLFIPELSSINPMGRYDKNFMAFTTKFSGLTNVLFTKVSLSLPYNPSVDKSQPPTPIECNAIWDTGASMSTITKSAAQKLGLLPSGKTQVSNTSEKLMTQDTYLINVYLPNKVALQYIRVVECKSLAGDFEFLVGMDIIANGDFSVTNINGKTVMSYRIPSIEEIDYVKEAEIVKANQKIFGKIEQQEEKREANISTSKIKERREKEKARKKAQKKNRKRKK